MKITRASVILEIDGHPHAMLMDGVNAEVLAVMLSLVTPNGKLNVVRMKDHFAFESLDIKDVAKARGES